jgi:hypothetical protein
MGAHTTQPAGRELRTQSDALGSCPLKNPQHEKLAREYAGGATMAAAWRTIGRDSAIGNQWRTFRRADIQARVKYLRDQFNEMAGIGLAALQARLLRIADANVVELFEADERGALRLRDLTKLPAAVTTPITELSIDKDGAVKVKSADKLHAIDSLIKTVGGFAPENSDGPKGTTLEDLIHASMAKSDTKVAFQVVTGVPRTPDEPPVNQSNGATKSAAAQRRIRRLEF